MKPFFPAALLAYMALTSSCAPAASPSALSVDDPGIVCSVALQFDDDNERAAFLNANVSALVHGANSGNLRVIGQVDSAALTILAISRDCAPRFLTEDFALEITATHIGTIDRIPAADARRMLEESLSDAPNDAVRECVLRFEPTGEDDVGLLFSLLPFVGLRDVRIQGANQSVYVASSDSCDLTARFVAGAMEELHGAPPQNLVICGRSSYNDCRARNE